MSTERSNNSEIQFLVTERPSTSGRTEVVLRLYRSHRLISETVVAEVSHRKARSLLLMSRIQLSHLGYEEHVPTTSDVERPQSKKDWTSNPRESLFERPWSVGRSKSLAGTLSRLPFRPRSPGGLGFHLRGWSAAASSLRHSVRAKHDNE